MERKRELRGYGLGISNLVPPMARKVEVERKESSDNEEVHT